MSTLQLGLGLGLLQCMRLKSPCVHPPIRVRVRLASVYEIKAALCPSSTKRAEREREAYIKGSGLRLGLGLGLGSIVCVCVCVREIDRDRDR